MQSFTISKDATVTDVDGLVQIDPLQNSKIQIGETLNNGTVLHFPKGSQVILSFDDGSEQKIIAPVDSANDELLVETIGVQKLQDTQAAEQSQIESIDTESDVSLTPTTGEQVPENPTGDIVGPDTRVGESGNEGTFFVTLERDANETIASAGYDTFGQEFTVPPLQDPLLLESLLLPTLTQPDINTIEEDTTATGNVLENDIDLDDALTVQSFTVAGDPTIYLAGETAIIEDGSLIISQDGSYGFTPADNWNGTLPIVIYTTNTNATDTLTINVTPVSDLTDNNELVTTPEDTAISGNVLTNSNSADGTPQVISFNVNENDFILGETAELPQGDLTLNANGSYTFIPADNFNGAVPQVIYTISDGVNTLTSILDIVVTPVNDPPIAANDSFSVNEGATVSGNVITNDDGDGVIDTDGGDGGTLTITQVNGVDLVFDPVTGEAAVAITDGTVFIQADGSFRYVHNGNEPAGAAPSFTYTLSDGTDTDIGEVSIDVTPVNDPPVAANDSFSVNEGATVSGNVITNDDGDGVIDTDGGDGGTLTITQVNGVDLVFDPVTGEAAVAITDGTVFIQADGSFRYVHNGNEPAGAAPSFTYTLSDGTDTDIGEVSIDVTPVNDPPVAANDSFSVNEGATVSGNVITNDDGDGVIDTDGGDGGTLTITQVNGVDLVFDPVTGEAAVAIKDGMVFIQADGSFRYVHNGNEPAGAAPSFTYTLSDGTDTDIGEVSIDVTPVNDPPVAANDSFSVNEGATVSGNVITNDDGDGVIDTDGGDGGTLTITQVNGVDLVFDPVTGEAAVAITDGTVFIQADGSFRYVHNGNEPAGAAPSFTYTLSDGTDTDIGEVSIDVTPVNDPPVAANDSFSVNEGATVSGNVITNDDGDGVIDTDGGDGGTLTITQVNGVDLVFDPVTGEAAVAIKDGMVFIQADGSFRYVHNGNEPAGASPSFTYTLSDGTDTDIGEVSIDVTPVNNPPVAANDSFSVNEGATVSGNVITNDDGDGVIDTDGGDGGTLTITQVNGVDLVFDPVTGEAAVAITDGTVFIQADGSFRYVHNGNEPAGAAPSFTYTLSDGTDTDIGEVSIDVTPVNNPPVAANDSFSVNEGATVSGNVITNDDGDGVIDTDGGDGGTLTITQVNGVDLVFDPVTGEAAVAIKDGMVFIQADGSFRYVHNGNEPAGAAPSFTYTLSDGTDTDIGEVSIDVTPVNNPPVAANDSFSVNEGATVSGNVITNDDGDGVIDTDGGDGGTLTITQVNGVDLVFDPVTGEAAVAIKDGTVFIQADGSFRYVHNGNEPAGAAPSFTYTLSDGTDTDIGEVSIDVTPVNNPPVAANDSFSVNEGATVSGNVITNDDGDGVIDTDGGDGGTLTITQVNGVDLVFDPVTGEAAVAITDGTVFIQADGSFRYVHNGNEPAGAAPSFTYTLSDGTDTDIGEVSIDVTPVNDPPVAANDSFSVNEGATVSGNVITNDDGDGVIDTDGGDGGTLTITQVNGVDLVFDPVTGEAAVAIKDGMVFIQADGSFRYVHNGNEPAGAAPSFTYTLSDGTDTDIGEVSIDVTPVNNPPVAANDSFSVNEGATVSGNVITNDDGDGVIDTDGGDGGTLTITQVNGVDLVFDPVTGEAAVAITDGMVFIQADGSFRYVHNGNEPAGAAPSFTYTLSDGTDTDIGEVSIDVTPVNNPPVAANDSFSVNEGATVSGNVITNDDGDGVIDTDGGDGGTLTITQVNGVDLVFDPVTGEAAVAITDGTVFIQADGSFRYVHNGNEPAGAAPSFTYTLSDGTDTDIGEVSIDVTPVNDPPVAANDSFSVNEGATVSGNVITNDDGDGVIDTDGGDGGTLTITQVNGVDLVFDPVTGEAAVAIKDGMVFIQADGSFRYVHNGNEPAGAAPSFTYTLSDGTDTDIGEVSIDVTPVNDPPVAANDSFSVNEGATVSGNVITNDDGDGVIDTDGGDGGTLTITQVNGVDLVFDPVTGEAAVAITDGTVFIQADGSFRYVHNGNEPAGASPSFTYTLSDGTDTDIGEVIIDVTPVNDPPVAANDSFSVNEGATVSGNVITNDDGDGVIDTDGGDGGTLTITQVNGVDLVFDPVTGEAAVAIKDGMVFIQADGSFRYVHNGNEPAGAAPSFTYTLSDGTDTDIGEVSIDVTPVNDPPVAANDSFSVNEGATVSGNVITNDDGDGVIDTDGGDGGTLTITQVNGVDLVFDPVTGEAAVAITDGTVFIQADGSFRYVHNGNEPAGAAPSFTYTLSDGTDTDIGEVSIDVTPVNDPPVAANDSFSVNEGATVSGNVITNDDGDGVIDTDGGDGGTLTITQVNGVDLVFDPVTGEAAVAITDGMVFIQADGSFRYVHNGNEPAGASPSFTYTLSDGTDTDIGEVSIDVTPVNDPPVAANDSFSVNEGATVSGNVITNDDGDGVIDTDGGDGGTLTITQVNGVDLVFDPVTGEAAVAITDGTVFIQADGSFRYVHNGNEPAGAAPSFTYTLSDGTDTDIGEVSIDVTPVNNPPVAANDSFSVNEGATVSGNVITNDDGDGVIDTDGGDGGTLTITQVNGVDLVFDPVTGEAAVAIKDGMVFIQADGSFRYVHNGNEPAGAAPSFTYTLSDGTDTDIGEVSIDVTPVNDPPVAANDSFSVNEGATVSGNVITNDDGDGVIDTDGGDGGTLTITQVNGVDLVFDPVTGEAAVAITDGTVFIQADGSFRYVHNGNEPAGAAPSFTYTLSDGTDTDIGEVSIDVTPVNDPPVAANDSFSVNEGATVSGNVITNDDGDGVIDTDGGDGGTLTITQVNGVDLTFDPVTGEATVAIKDGTLSIKSDGNFTYNNVGYDLSEDIAPSFTYTLSDGIDEDIGEVTINVVDNAPVANDDINFIQLRDEGQEVIRGNVIGRRGSSGDNQDFSLDGFGTPAMTQVVFNGIAYVFSETVTEHDIVTIFGTLNISSNGIYQFSTIEDLAISAESSLEFEYTIQDNDLFNPETDSAILTILFRPATPMGPLSFDGDTFDSESIGTIDTTFDTKTVSTSETTSFLFSESTGDLSDILTSNKGSELEDYLAMITGESNDNESLDESVLSNNSGIDDMIILEKLETNFNDAPSVIISNGLLTDGAVIVADTAGAAHITSSELDSSELL